MELPKFSGNYTEWPAFCELFITMMNKTKLADAEKFYYLKGCLSGEPARLVSNLALTGASLDAAIAELRDRYENKRKLVQVHLVQLWAQQSSSAHNAQTLSQLITTAVETKIAVSKLVEPARLGDCLLVYMTTKQFDRETKDRWQSSLGTSKEYPGLDQLKEFVTARVRDLEDLEADQKAAQATKTARTQAHHQSARLTGPARTVSSQRPPAAHQGSTRPSPVDACDYCGQRHFIVACEGFRGLSPLDRARLVRHKRLCFNCLGRHSIKVCRTRQGCKKCSDRHHTMLHGGALMFTGPFEDETSAPKPSSGASSSPAHQRNTVSSTLLATAQATVISATYSHVIRLLIDPGSELSFITEALTCQLNLRRQRSNISIIGIGGTRSTETRGAVTLILHTAQPAKTVTIQAHVLSTVSTILPSFTADVPDWPHIKNLRLADQDFLTPRPIDVIIGADFYGEVIRPNIIKGPPSTPIAQLSIFGWLVLGPVSVPTHYARSAHTVTTLDDTSSLQELLTRFWIQEEPPSTSDSALTPEEEECEAHFCSTHYREQTGRYVVRIPLKEPATLLGNSYKTAQLCLHKTLLRLRKNPDYHQLYSSFMQEYEELGHMVRVSAHLEDHHQEIDNVESEGGMTSAHDVSASGGLRVSSEGSTAQSPAHFHPYYLPHHGVLKEDSATTKLRVVFNGSKATTSGRSVNDLMHTGANLLLNVCDVLIWLRHYHHLFATDITKMYRQIALHRDDWDLQRILWVDQHQKVVPYHLTTVTYGMKAAPFLATRTLQQLVQDEGHRFPLAVPSLTHGRYVDDIFGGADSVEELINVANQLIGLCHAGGFPLAKWHATHPEVLKAVTSDAQQSAIISFDDDATKLLGIQWLPQTDRFGFTAKIPAQPGKHTKRRILSDVARIFDPLGFASPVIVRAKMLLQELWLHKVSWDDELPSPLTARWLDIREELNSLARLSIPRWFRTCKDSTVELHGFSDASQLAMAAVIYITVSSPSTSSMRSLVCAKTKVAPLKKLTIPRLELTAALLLTKLARYVSDTLQVQLKATHLWTDSNVTLTWIKSQPGRWKEFVRNRVSQIQELAPDAQWRHVPGTSNPADCASRGISTDRLEKLDLWWEGPRWLTQPIEHWPAQPVHTEAVAELEVRPNVSLIVTAPKLSYHWDLIYKYSSLVRLYRLTALCSRLVARLRRRLKDPPVVLIPSEAMEKAKLFWTQATQQLFYRQELKLLSGGSMLHPAHPFNRLTAFIDSEGTLRVGGRLAHAALPAEEKHPAILPKEALLTKLIIEDAHRRTLHGGTQLTLAYIRQTHWIIGGRAPVKSHILKCVVCARQRGIRAQQLMGQLPLCRVTPSRPFTNTGLDYAGPITLKISKGRGFRTTKGWICIFVCLASSAVHLEVVSDYSTQGFLAAYRRFSARRGLVHTLYSDCGTNFIGADAELKRLFSASAKEHLEIASILSVDSTQWRFNPPAAPHMGGKWEAVVKSMKFHLRRTIKEPALTFEEATTLIAQIEAVLNSRPLEPLSDDPEDISALTPGHFLIGSALNTVPEPSLLHIKESRLSNWQRIQQQTQQFWQQWSAHYLQRLQAICKWHHPAHQLKVGALVLITHEHLPPSKWPLARVTALHPGKDGLSRVATLKTATTSLVRPIHKLIILPTRQEKEDSASHQQ